MKLTKEICLAVPNFGMNGRLLWECLLMFTMIGGHGYTREPAVLFKINASTRHSSGDAFINVQIE